MAGLYSTLFYSTGRGGGDIEDLGIGRWAGDRLSIVEKTFADVYTEVSDDVETIPRGVD